MNALERSVGGVIACVLAAIPLAIGYSVWGFYIETHDREWPFVYVLLSTVIIGFFSMLIAALSSVLFGIPVYALAVRAKRLRPLVILASATVVGVIVHEAWHGGGFLEDPKSALEFAFFGFYSGIAFWLGADVWQPVR